MGERTQPRCSWRRTLLRLEGLSMMMMRLALVACVWTAACAEDFLEPEETGVKPSTLERQKFTFSLEHDVSGTGSVFTKRNEVMYEASPGAKRNRPTVRVSKFAFTPEEVESIEQLARSGGVYRIRAPTSLQSDTEDYVMSYVPACALVASRYTEHLVFHLGPNGNILGVDLNTPNTDCSAVTATAPRKGKGKKIQVSSTVRVDLGMDAEKPTMPEKFEEFIKDNAPGPDGQPREKKQKEEDPGFLRRYWYIWPIVIMMTMGGGDPPQQKRK